MPGAPSLRENRSPPGRAAVAVGARRLAPLACLLLAGACASPPTPDGAAIEQRLQRLERRIESLERRDRIEPQPPLRSREEIEGHIQSLEAERAALLTKYHSAHPDIRAIDRQVQLLRKQLDMLGPSARPAR